jgi:hypothetical protein
MSKVAFLVWLLVLTPCFLFAQDSSKSSIDPSGTWRWEYDLDGTQFKDLVRLKVGQENKETKERELKGKYESSSGRKINIENGKIF